MNGRQFLGLADHELLAQCDVHTYRASGPGGQKRNKTSSAVRLHHRPSGLISKAEEDRSQHINRRRALKRLRLALATELLQAVNMSSPEVSGCLRGCINHDRLQLHLKHEAFLPAINELLSLLDSAAGQVSTVAELLGVSTANLIRIFELDPRIWRKVNWIRQAHQLHALKSAHT